MNPKSFEERYGVGTNDAIARVASGTERGTVTTKVDKEVQSVITTNEKSVSRERDVDSLERTLEQLSSGLAKKRESLELTHDQLRTKESSKHDAQYTAMYGKITSFRNRIKTLKAGGEIDSVEFQKLRNELAALVKEFRGKEVRSVDSAEDTEETLPSVPDTDDATEAVELTPGQELRSRREAVASASAAHNEALTRFYAEHFGASGVRGKWRNVKQFFGIKPELPEEVRKLAFRERNAQREYVTYANKVAEDREFINKPVNALSDVTGSMPQERAQKVLERYYRIIDSNLAIKPQQERLHIQKEAIANSPQAETYTNLKRLLGKHKNTLRIGKLLVYGGVGAATGGVATGVLAASRVGAGMVGGVAGGALANRGYGKIFTERSIKTTENIVQNERITSLSFADLAARQEKILAAFNTVEKHQRNQEIAGLVGALLGGAGAASSVDMLGNTQTVEVNRNEPSTNINKPETADEIEYGGERVAIEQAESTAAESTEQVESVTQNPHPPLVEDGEVVTTPKIAEENAPSQTVPTAEEEVGTIGTLDSDGFQDREPNVAVSEQPVASAREVVADVQNLVPNPEQMVTIPESGRIDTLSEAFYQKYCDGELTGLPEGMSASEFKAKMWAAFHALDNNGAVMERMHLPNTLSGGGDVDKVLLGQSVNVAPLIEHMNGHSVAEIEKGLYTPDNELARADGASQTAAPETSVRPEARPEVVATPNDELDPKSAEYQAAIADTLPQAESTSPDALSGNFESQALPLYAEVFGPSVEVPQSYKIALQTELGEWVNENNVTSGVEQAEHIKAMMVRDTIIMQQFNNPRLLPNGEYHAAYDAHGVEFAKHIEQVSNLSTQPYLSQQFTLPENLLATYPETTTFGDALMSLVKDGKIVMKNGVISFPNVSN